jgi:ribonuclease BN (tRNA processing enzyme)
MGRPGKTREARFTLLGVGAMNSPRYRPADLLVDFLGSRIMLDGGPGAEPDGRLDAWLVTDNRGELIREIRTLARKHGVEACVGPYSSSGFTVKPIPVVHTSHPTYGYLFTANGRKVVWAPEFFQFPAWARGAELMFAEAASWNRPIRFANRVGGHSPVLEVAREAERYRVRRLVFAHIGRPTIRAMDARNRPPFGGFGIEGHVYRVRIPRSQRS